MITSYKYLYRTLFFLVILLSLNSCIKDEYDFDKFSPNITIKPNIALPIAYGDLKLSDFLPDSSDYYYIDQKNMLHIVFSRVLDSILISDFLDKLMAQDTIIDYISGHPGLPIPFNFLTTRFNAGEVITEADYVGISYKAPPQYPHQRLDSISFVEAKLTITFTPDFPFHGSYTISFPTSRKPPYTSADTIFYTFTDDFLEHQTVTREFDLKGCIFKLVNNRFPVRYNFKFNKTSRDIADAEKITTKINIDKIIPRSVSGYLDTVSFVLKPDTLHIKLNADILKGHIYLNDLSAKLYIKNSVGLPVRFTLHPGSKAVKGSVSMPVNLYPPSNPKDLAYPLIRDHLAEDSMILDKTTSNILDLIDFFPDKLLIGGTFKANIGKDPYTTENFATINSKVIFGVRIDLPLDLEISNFNFMDTVAVEWKSKVEAIQKSNKNVKQVTLQMVFDNGLPLEAGVQCYLYNQDTSGKIDSALVDSLFLMPGGLHLLPADVDAGGIVSNSKSSGLIEVIFSESQLDKIKNVRYIIVKAYAKTTGASSVGPHKPVKILSNYRIGFKFGIKTLSR